MKKLLLLALLLASCGVTAPVNTTTDTRDTEVFPDRKYPLRMIQVEFKSYYGNNRADVVFIKNVADSAVDYSTWKTRVASSGVVSSLGSVRFATAGVSGSSMSPQVTLFFSALYLRGDRQDTLRRAADTVELIAPDGQITQRIAWVNKTTLAPVLPFWKGTSPLKINFVVPNPSGNDANSEIVEIHNISADTVPLANWTLKSKQGNQIKFLTEKTLRILPFAKYQFQFTSAAWLNNEGDSITLVSPDGKEIHTATWGNLTSPEGVYFYPVP